MFVGCLFVHMSVLFFSPGFFFVRTEEDSWMRGENEGLNHWETSSLALSISKIDPPTALTVTVQQCFICLIKQKHKYNRL